MNILYTEHSTTQPHLQGYRYHNIDEVYGVPHILLFFFKINILVLLFYSLV